MEEYLNRTDEIMEKRNYAEATGNYVKLEDMGKIKQVIKRERNEVKLSLLPRSVKGEIRENYNLYNVLSGRQKY